jgi:methyltransferase (TIGR00027 family)
MMHDAGTRADPAAKRLAAHLPGTAPLIWLLMMGPTRLAMRVSGFRPQMVEYPPTGSVGLVSTMTVRTWFFDRTLNDELANIDQLVILGAGWDTRAFSLPADWSGRVFEVDAPATHRAKVQAISDSQLETSRATFVAVDFSESSWLEVLIDHDFDPELPTYVLCEGVTMYLEATDIADIFACMRKLGKGSVIGFDYIAAELIEARPPHTILGKLIPLGMKLTYGEKFGFGIPMQPNPAEALTGFLKEQKMELLQFETLSDGSIYGFGLAKSFES